MDIYKQLVHPLSYDFCLVKNHAYIVLEVLLRRGTPWLYVISSDMKDNELQITPDALFSFDWNEIPKDWSIRITGDSRENIEILAKKIASIENWFEKYIDEKNNTLNLINQEIKRMKDIEWI